MSLFERLFKKKLDPFELSDLKVDIHSHLIPGIDDGSRTMDESIAMLAKFESLGYLKVITTPHIMSEVYPNNSERILEGLEDVRENAQKLGLKISIEAAAEYYFDETLEFRVKEKNFMTFGENYVLVEFAFHNAPMFEERLFFEMQMAGYKPVLAHFERYMYYLGSVDKAAEYKEKGVCIQMNLNSLTGHYGLEVKKQAERLIDSGLIDFVGTDCHRMDHLMLLENNLSNPYMHKLKELPLRNRLL
ncbi:MAG: histidinol phosphatase [Cryomorphaceae bacterium]|jgi:tyrosine-protein phosphatase YwqE|nr:histidinol phosphatase [Cryomorphaceae bacterium]